jgi:hypothetical protein
METQYSTMYGDKQCCEDDFNQTTKILARILFPLSVIALFIHIFIRRFYQC